MVAPDVSLLLEGADAPKARRGRNTDAPGKLDVGHAPVGLQLGQDLSVDRIESRPRHGSPALWLAFFTSPTHAAQ
jgi:hypothetical protein